MKEQLKKLYLQTYKCEPRYGMTDHTLSTIFRWKAKYGDNNAFKSCMIKRCDNSVFLVSLPHRSLHSTNITPLLETVSKIQ